MLRQVAPIEIFRLFQNTIFIMDKRIFLIQINGFLPAAAPL